MIKKIIAFLIIMGALLILLLYSQRNKESLKVSGFIEADEIRIGSRVGGRVLQVSAIEGKEVTKGEVLVELEPYDLMEQKARAEALLAEQQADYAKYNTGYRQEEIAQAKARRDQIAAVVDKLIHGPRKQDITTAEAQLELAKAELALAQLEFTRSESLFKRNVAPQEQLDQAISKLKVAQSKVNVSLEELDKLKEGTRQEEISEAKAKLDEAEQVYNLYLNGYRKEDIMRAKSAVDVSSATLKMIERQLEELIIRAPVEGVIEAVELQTGDLVPANAPVISIMDTSKIWVRAYVPENRLTIKVGQKVLVTTDSIKDKKFGAHISFIARQAEFTPGNVQTPEERSKQVFRIKVMIDEGLDQLKPGMSADVWFEGIPN